MNFLKHPLTKDLDIDNPNTTLLRRDIILQKNFLKNIYNEWYQNICINIPDGEGEILELGSGGSFIKDISPEILTSELFWLPEFDIILDGQQLPFADGQLKAIIMTNVLHHIPDVERFFSEAQRCLRPQGKIILLEPWVSSWSKFIYKNFHDEPFEMDAKSWKLPGKGPLSSANGALPWILFERDQSEFYKRFSSLKIELIRGTMPFRYLLSGGVSMRALVPDFSYRFWKWIDTKASKMGNMFNMFAYIIIERN
ncbi:MAG: class I SAM-dependent methyltransferase [Anaerolineae bacterium]|nr:class I SAM-dependent methyltransferase [Anaerolineae bacterium]